MNKRKKVIFGKIFTSFNPEILTICNKDVRDVLFTMRFPSKELRNSFDKVLGDIDLNGYVAGEPLNYVKITFENAYSQKDRKRLDKARKEGEETKEQKKKRMKKYYKAEALRIKDDINSYEKILNDRKKSYKKYQKLSKRVN